MSATSHYDLLRHRYDDCDDEMAGKMMESAHVDMVDELKRKRAAMTPEQRVIAETEDDIAEIKRIGAAVGNGAYRSGKLDIVRGVESTDPDVDVDADVITKAIMIDAANARLWELSGERTHDVGERERRATLRRNLVQTFVAHSLPGLIGADTISVQSVHGVITPNSDAGRKLAELLGRSTWDATDIMRIKAAGITVSVAW